MPQMLHRVAFDAQICVPLSVPTSLAVTAVSVCGRVACRLVCYHATIRRACAATGLAPTTFGRWDLLGRITVCVWTDGRAIWQARSGGLTEGAGEGGGEWLVENKAEWGRLCGQQ